MTATVSNLFTYPIKGLSGQKLDSVELEKGRGFPFDRAFAFSRFDSGMDPDAPRPMPKSRFLVLARDAALARLATKFDIENRELTVRDGEIDLKFDLSSTQGIGDAATFLSGVVGLEAEKRPNFVYGGDLRFTDVCMASEQMMHCVSVINLASVREFGDAIGKEVDPKRFRGNFLIDGWPPFAELDAVGKEFEIAGARLRILKRTKRCPATKVNLETAERDIDVPELLDETYGHRDMGVYAEVIEGGHVKTGDEAGML